jgi:cyclic pyranopterin phosphate synthase
MNDFTHFNSSGAAHMVDVSAKNDTVREAVASARVLFSAETFELVKTGGMKKGDVLSVARLAGIMGCKKTPELIPLCHPVAVSGAEVDLTLNDADFAVEITATVRATGATGVEMEALTAVSVAALTVYDMCKAVQRGIEITDIKLLKKSGGKSGEWINTKRP